MVLVNYRRFATFANVGALEPLGGYLEKPNLINEADVYPEVISAFKWQSGLICIPQNISSLVVYWNDLVTPLLYLRSQTLYTLPVGFQEMDKTNWLLLMSASVVMAIHAVMVFSFLQRAFRWWGSD